MRLLDFLPKDGELVSQIHARKLESWESLLFAGSALALRYPKVEAAPVDAETLLKAHRPEDEGTDLWRTLNRVQSNIIQGGVSDWHKDRRGKLRSVRKLSGIDSKVSINKGLWGLAGSLVKGEPLEAKTVTLAA